MNLNKGLADFIGTLNEVQKDLGCSRDEAARHLCNMTYNVGVQEGRRQGSKGTFLFPFLTGLIISAIGMKAYQDYQEEKKKKAK